MNLEKVLEKVVHTRAIEVIRRCIGYAGRPGSESTDVSPNAAVIIRLFPEIIDSINFSRVYLIENEQCVYSLEPKNRGTNNCVAVLKMEDVKEEILRVAADVIYQQEERKHK